MISFAQHPRDRDRASTAYAAELVQDTPLLEGGTHGIYSSVALSTGYDTAVYGVTGASGQLVVLDTSIGFLSRHRRYTMLLEHNAKVTRSFGTHLGVQQFQRTAASLIGDTSRNTSWSLLLENGYGEDSARSIGSLTGTTLTSSVPNQDTAVFSASNSNTLNDHVALEVDHQLTAERTGHVTAEGFVRHFYGQGATSQQYSTRGSITQAVSPRYVLGLGAEAVQQDYSSIHCVTASATLFASVQLKRGSELRAAAGPSGGTGGCAGGYVYDTILTVHEGKSSQWYMGGSRRSSDGYIMNSSRETLVYAGGVLGPTSRTQSRFDAGFANYSLIDSGGRSTGALHGYFVSGEIHRRLSSTSDLSLTARFFSSGGNQPDVHRALVLLTYAWTHQPQGARNADIRGAAYDR